VILNEEEGYAEGLVTRKDDEEKVGRKKSEVEVRERRFILKLG
jgi:hypothetical protein